MVELSSSCLASLLRQLLSILKNRSPQTYDYRDTVKSESAAALGLDRLIASVFSKVGGVQDAVYSTFLLKRIILSRFRLLCGSSELIQDVIYSFEEFKNILLAMEMFNHHCLVTCPPRTRIPGQTIEVLELINAYIESHVEWLSSTLTSKPLSEIVLHLARFESNFSQALLGLIVNYTSLLNSSASDGGLQKYVSEDMFSMCSSPDNISWSDCLIPGAQSETLKKACKDNLNRLWGRVADSLAARAQPLLLGEWNSKKSVPWFFKASQLTDLESFPVVVSCLEHVLATRLQQQCLIAWDAAFQKYLACTLMEYRRSYRLLKSKPPTMAASCSSALSFLDNYMTEQVKDAVPVTTNSYESIINHVDILRHTLPVSWALKVSLKHATFSLLQNLSSNVCSWNLTSLASLMFRDIPMVRDALKRSIGIAYCAVSPRVSFPAYCSSLHSLEWSSRGECSALHETSTHLQERVEEFYEYFQSVWASRCAQLLKSYFPRVKYWRNFRIKGDRRQIKHSTYCDVVIENLFLPMAEAALRLPNVEQKNFVFLMITVFYNEYRKIITSNRKLYSIFAGQQLLADHHYMQQWLASSEQQLGKASLQLLSSAPILMEVERGLLTLCKIAGVEETDSNELGRPLGVSLPSHNFPVLDEVAWNLSQDWDNCIS